MLIGFGCISFLENLQFGIFPEIILTYNAFVEDYPYMSEFISSKSGLNTFIILFFVILGMIALTIYIKDKIVIIKHMSLSNTLSPYNKESFKEYSVIEKEIDLSICMEKKRIKEAIKTQDDKIKEIKNTSKNKELMYYGVAHSPLIFRAGFQIGDERNVRLFHKKRNGKSTFEELADNDEYRIKFDEATIIGNNDVKEVLVVIETSLKINRDSLRIFYEKDLNAILAIGLENEHMYDFDNMDSYAVMQRMRKHILQYVRKYTQENNIERIHMVLSTSSAFTFYLAQAFSSNHDPEIIVYHYDSNSKEKYPWGISNIADAENAIVYLKKSQTI